MTDNFFFIKCNPVSVFAEVVILLLQYVKDETYKIKNTLDVQGSCQLSTNDIIFLDSISTLPSSVHTNICTRAQVISL